MAYEPFVQSCNDSANFPNNLIFPELHGYDLQSYFKRFQEHGPRLFCGEETAAVDIWDLGDGERGKHAMIAHFMSS